MQKVWQEQQQSLTLAYSESEQSGGRNFKSAALTFLSPAGKRADDGRMWSREGQGGGIHVDPDVSVQVTVLSKQ